MSVKKIALFITGFVLILFSSCKNEVGKKSEGNISFGGKKYDKTEFVYVILENDTAKIPDGINCTNIDDVFLECRTITLNSYTMCRYEVTQELYEAVKGKIPYADEENLYKNEKQQYRPVAGVSWFDAVDFCIRLSELCGYDPVYSMTNIKKGNKGKKNEYISSATVTWDFSKNGYRLPTEAEWEYAARGAGLTTEDWNYKFSGGDISKQVAWTSLNSSGYSDKDETLRTHEVGLKKANALGIYDMSGNVSEWCTDWYRSVTEDNDFSHGNAVRDSGSVTDPCLLKGNYDNHVIRGGSYKDSSGIASNWQRMGLASYAGYGLDESAYQGIRLVRRP